MNTIKCKKIEYNIVYGKIKNLYIHVKDGNVIVKAPKYISKEYIDNIIDKKRDWILKKLEETKTVKKEREYTNKDIEKLKNKLDVIFKELIEETNLIPNKVRIRNIKCAWGSCSSNKNITINLKLVDRQDIEIKYVVLHELCHLKYMNHSEKFWNLVEKYMPEYKKIRKELKYDR
ncbi:MAG: M48 family metallopeptidase [Clostridia bacterium]|jgi:hypothetical protein